MSKLVISNKEIDLIKDFAIKAFKNTPRFIDLDAKEMQTALILMGLETFLTSRGIESGFEVRLKEVGDSMPIDESGVNERD